jgi:hypothetical protein
MVCHRTGLGTVLMSTAVETANLSRGGDAKPRDSLSSPGRRNSAVQLLPVRPTHSG